MTRTPIDAAACPPQSAMPDGVPAGNPAGTASVPLAAAAADPAPSAPVRRFIRTRSARLSIRWTATIAVAALTTAAVLGAGAVAERNTRRALTREIETRLLLEARNLALTSAEALLADFPELALHPLTKEMKAGQPELAFVQVLDHEGVVQGDPDVHRLGTRPEADPNLRPIDATLPLGPGEGMKSDGEVLVATARVAHRDGRAIGTAMVGLRRDYIEGMIEEARRQLTLVFSAVLVIAIVGSFVLMSFLLRPISALRSGIERIGRGDLDSPLQLRDMTELGVLAEAVNDMAAELKQAQAEMLERERLAHEVELARQIQTSLLPDREIRAGPFVCRGSQRAAAEVGGDYFDYFALPDGRIGVAVADVAGKGLAGCLVMSMLSALLRAYRATQSSPASLLAVLDERLGETLQSGSFVTMFYGVLDPESGELVYASAGHSPLLVYRRATGTVEWLRSKGIPLGALRGGAIRATLHNASLNLAPGDLIVQFTDGINEAFDPSGKHQFGFERMETVVKQAVDQGPGAVISALHRSVGEWAGDGPPLDDETVLVLSREPDAHTRAGTTSGPTETDDLDGADPLALLEVARRGGHCLRLQAAIETLPVIRDWLEQRFPDADQAGPDFELLTTALYEACANIAEHGCAEDPTREFELWWIPGVDAIPRDRVRPGGGQAGDPEGPGPPDPRREWASGCFLIRDHGIPFRADNWRKTDFSDPKVWRRGRGFGLDIIHRAMNRVAYHPGTAEGNVTVMTFAPATERPEREELRYA